MTVCHHIYTVVVFDQFSLAILSCQYNEFAIVTATASAREETAISA